MTEVRLGDRIVAAGRPVFVVAEAGVNHNGDLALAKHLVNVAADAGADAVKFQTFRAERLATPSAPKADYQLAATDRTETQCEMLRRLELSEAAHHELRGECAGRGVMFLSTPFDEASADLLDALGVLAFKLGSGEVTNRPLLEHVARKGRPVILSTGMSYLGEVDEALGWLGGAGCHDVVLLHCVSNYPADPGDANLRAIETMRQAFGVPVGFSDHTTGIDVALAAVALGACVIEKHFTLDRTLPGPDHRASLEPGELATLIASIRRVESALGDGVKRPVEAEAPNRRLVRRSLAAATDLAAGSVVDASTIWPLRPGTGIPPTAADVVVGRRLIRSIRAGELIDWNALG